MVFSSVIFIFIFLPVVLILHSLLLIFTENYSLRAANIFLLISSLFFYAWGEPYFVYIIIASSIINFYTALLLHHSNKDLYKKIIVFICIFLNLGLLCYFKYAKLIRTSFEFMFYSLPAEYSFLNNVVLPLGISFYTFQGMSYVFDVYWKKHAPTKYYTDFLCYLCMFPQLIAGPIVRYVSISKELVCRKFTTENFASGAQCFIFGLAKKVLLADTFGKVADTAFKIPIGELPLEAAWLGIACYTLQIYFDFSGYSDMAIGMGRMMGFTFPENFNYPYVSRSIREFWQRWHITLSQWFRDYLYIPLGGKHCPRYRIAINLFIVFALCGLWHGATYGFLIWGLYHGVFLVFERCVPNFIASLPRILQHIYVIFVVMMGWVIFRTEDILAAKNYFAALFGLHTPKTLAVNSVWLEAHGYALPLAFVFSIILATPIYPYMQKKFSATQNTFYCAAKSTASLVMTISLFLLSCLPVVASSYKSFIYFRF